MTSAGSNTGSSRRFPLWGKLGLEEDVARAQAGAARETQRAIDLEVAARIKTVFARYYAAFESGRLTRELYRTVATLADVTQSRYAQGFGEQDDAIRAEVEKTRLRTELVRFEADQRQAAAQLNALMDRRAGALLAEPAALRPVPTDTLAVAELVERAEMENPSVERRRGAGSRRRGREGAGGQDLVSGCHAWRRRPAVRRAGPAHAGLRGDDRLRDPAAMGPARGLGARGLGQSGRVAPPPRRRGGGPARRTGRCLLGARRRPRRSPRC